MITRLYVRVRQMLDEARGASAVEYGLLVAGIAAAVVAIVFVIGAQADAAFDVVSVEISDGVDPSFDPDAI